MICPCCKEKISVVFTEDNDKKDRLYRDLQNYNKELEKENRELREHPAHIVDRRWYNQVLQLREEIKTIERVNKYKANKAATRLDRLTRIEAIMKEGRR